MGFLPVCSLLIEALWRIFHVLAGFARDVLVDYRMLCFYKLMLYLFTSKFL